MAVYKKSVEIPGKTADELFEVCSKAIQGLVEQMSVGQPFELTPDPASKTFQLSAKPVKATLICEDGRLTLDGEMSFMLLPFRSKIDAGIDRWLSKTFNLKA